MCELISLLGFAEVGQVNSYHIVLLNKCTVGSDRALLHLSVWRQEYKQWLIGVHQIQQELWNTCHSF